MDRESWESDEDWEDWTDDDQREDDCDHVDDIELDVCTGRFECSCGHSWYATEQEFAVELDRQAQYYKWAERENRRQWWRDQFNRLSFWRRRSLTTVNDDEIPF